MDIDVKEFSEECSCLKNHQIFVKDIMIEKDAINRLPELLQSEVYKKYQSLLIVCDDNTYEVAGRKVQKLIPNSKIVILPANGLHADNRGVELLLNKVPDETELLLAVGSGTIHDLTRYVAFTKTIPFISIPTAASVDGYVSTVAAMTWDGLKKTMTAVSPICVIADSNIFSKAPYRLTASGVSDLLGKYSALADWKIAHLLTGEYFCDRVYNLELVAVNKVCECVDDLKNGKIEAYEQLMYALLLSGLAMQMVGNSRPASGAEHHISHLWESEVLNDTLDALHGEKVSLGLIITSEVYHKVATCIHNGSVKVREYKSINIEEVKDAFTKNGLYEGIMKENESDVLTQVDATDLRSKLEMIANILDEIPSTLQIQHILTYAGCVTKMTEIGLSNNIISDTIRLSPYVRSRLTFMRIMKMLEFTEYDKVEVLGI
ncbi:sn-glycerol-1-phosphate dehydrogenase [Anaeromicropila herbilytica]|uniref:3-dehydroquinate synthase n=1 Tax=Anaeromicropila herbilytica TaxID=2785025 RepID=A0A7R7EMA6_9FIRM|nr:sn-glycerol-1-phosphate dehydrogenase [Anaeromicropila herbilytica]BCN31449.1 3-dehydroquinate synthase [Anaeromicropila herbilytica]